MYSTTQIKVGDFVLGPQKPADNKLDRYPRVK